MRNFASTCKIDNLIGKSLEKDIFFEIIILQWRSAHDGRQNIIEDHW